MKSHIGGSDDGVRCEIHHRATLSALGSLLLRPEGLSTYLGDIEPATFTHC